MRTWIVSLLVGGLGAASVAATGWARPPQTGILQPAGGGVEIAYVVGGVSTRCSFRRVGRLPQVTCAVRGQDGRIPRQYGASIDRQRVVFYRVGVTRRVLLVAVSQRPGLPVYGAYQPDPHPRLIQLAEGASIGFLGTNIACAAVRDGPAPAMRCLAHAGPGLPGPCCGPNFPLLVGSYGFYLSPSRLQELLVVATGVRTGSGPHPSPYRIVDQWRR